MFSKSLEYRTYADLRKQYENVECKTGQEVVHFLATSEDLIPMDEHNSLVVFDDCLIDEEMKVN